MPDRNGRLNCSSSTRVTTRLLLSFLLLLPATHAIVSNPIDSQSDIGRKGSHTFTLRHIFHRGTYRDPDLHKRLDISPSQRQYASAFENEQHEANFPLEVKVQSEDYEIERLADRKWPAVENHLDYASLTGLRADLHPSAWTLDTVPGPDVTDKDSVINLALIAANAYIPEVGDGEWANVSQGYNHSTAFGWEGDGLRGHIFADEGNKTIVVGLKGTSPAVFDGDGTTTRDKLNDNLLFSCCCGQGGQYFWRQVCDCQTSTYTCNSTCVVKSLKDKSRYYSASIDLYNNVTALYPNSTIWIVGHSLGGSVSSLLGLTFGLPVVTFEAPGDDLAAKRLGLPVPPRMLDGNPHRGKYNGARHFGHTADPVFMGSCNGPTATCTLGGYAMESQCHTGMQCVYDTVSDYGWRVGIGYHKIHNVIDNVIRKYKEVPKCVPDYECTDCYNWKYFESNGSDSTTTTKTTTTSRTSYTRTSTCKTPGWWGCLDETTTGISSTHQVVTTTYTMTTCLTPGWFGCVERGNVTITTTTEPPKQTSTSVPASTTSASTTLSHSTTCRPGWFGGGCESTSTTSHHPAPTKTAKDNETCETPGIFFGCWDPEPRTSHTRYTETKHSTITSPPMSTVTETKTTTAAVTGTNTATKTPRRKCKHRAFFGLICLDSKDEGVAEVERDEWRTAYTSEL